MVKVVPVDGMVTAAVAPAKHRTDGMDGTVQGPEIYYYKDSEEGLRAAERIAAQLAQVYPFSGSGMQTTGGRRIKRAIFLDQRSVRFLTDEEIRKIRGNRMRRKASRVSEAALKQLRSVSPPADYAEQLSDRVYDRFSERSVGLENTLQAIRMGFADAAPWLALLVLLFFGFSLWYVQNH